MGSACLKYIYEPDRDGEGTRVNMVIARFLDGMCEGCIRILPSSHLSISLPPHIHHLQRSILQLNHVPRFQRFGVDVVYVVRVEDTRFGARENGLFPGGIGEAETTPAADKKVSMYIYQTRQQWKRERKREQGRK